MKHYAIFVAVILLISPRCVSAETSLWSRASMWWGTNETSLTGGVAYGANVAKYTNGFSEYVDGSNFYFFRGSVSSRCDFAHLDTTLYAICIGNVFPVWQVSGMAGSTNTIAICGPSGTGTISYWVTVLSWQNVRNEGVGSPSNTFAIEHEGQIIPFYHFYGSQEFQAYTSAPQPIVFGVPFKVATTVSSQISYTNGPLVVADSTVFVGYEFELFRFFVWDSQGTLLTNNLTFTVTSEAGAPFPKAPNCLGNYGSTNLSVYWHSIKDKPYRFQGCTNLLENVWTNVGDAITGSGSTNFVDLPITEAPMQTYRLYLP